MDIDKAVTLTQDRLAEEGGSMGDLLGYFRNRIAPVLIGREEWERVLECAGRLPITMGAHPFGFELPLHERRPVADLGVSLASGTRSAAGFEARVQADEPDATATAVMRLFGEMESGDSPLREIVGRKLMLEYDIGPAEAGESLPGMFLRPGERPLIAGGGHADDVRVVSDALVSCLGWERDPREQHNVERAYLAQPGDTRMDSFGVFPSRSPRAIRLAIMGFKSRQEVSAYLRQLGWPGQISAVESVIARFEERANIVRTGVNVDVRAEGLGPTLGLTLIVKQRYTRENSRYWLDGLTDWDPFLEALGHEALVDRDKLGELAGWVSKPSVLFAKSGRFVLLRGIHHVKLVIAEDDLRKVKAYVFMVLSAAHA